MYLKGNLNKTGLCQCFGNILVKSLHCEQTSSGKHLYFTQIDTILYNHTGHHQTVICDKL